MAGVTAAGRGGRRHRGAAASTERRPPGRSGAAGSPPRRCRHRPLLPRPHIRPRGRAQQPALPFSRALSCDLRAATTAAGCMDASSITFPRGNLEGPADARPIRQGDPCWLDSQVPTLRPLRRPPALDLQPFAPHNPSRPPALDLPGWSARAYNWGRRPMWRARVVRGGGGGGLAGRSRGTLGRPRGVSRIPLATPAAGEGGRRSWGGGVAAARPAPLGPEMGRLRHRGAPARVWAHRAGSGPARGLTFSARVRAWGAGVALRA